MKKLLSLLLVCMLASTLLAGCNNDAGTSAAPSQQQETSPGASPVSLSGTVATCGSTSVEGTLSALIEAFKAIHPDVAITYDPQGSGAGITAASEGTVDIGLSSRALKDTETGLDTHIYALDGIAIIVNTGNTVTDLSVEQIAGLFTGEITNWSEVGGPDNPVSPIGREEGSGTRSGFEEIIGVAENCQYDQELTSTGAVIAAVKSNEFAIGYASLSAVGDSVTAVAVNGVVCSADTVKDGSYTIQRPFIMLTRTGQTLSPEAAAFLEFALSSDAKDIIIDAGAVQP